jgi:ABC-type Zn uptake system ZnuABC Zn-binding protein ZnuA
MRAQSVKSILVEDFYNRSVAETVAEKADAKVLPMPSDVGARADIKDYFGLVDAVLAMLSK